MAEEARELVVAFLLLHVSARLPIAPKLLRPLVAAVCLVKEVGAAFEAAGSRLAEVRFENPSLHPLQL